MNQNGEIRVLYVQPGKYPEEIKIPNTLETFQKYVCGSIESVRLDRDAYIICNDEGKLLPLPPNRLYTASIRASSIKLHEAVIKTVFLLGWTVRESLDLQA